MVPPKPEELLSIIIGRLSMVSDAIFIEAVFIYAIPSVIVEDKNVLGALGRSLSLFRSRTLTTLTLVFIPNFLTILMMSLKNILPYLMKISSPEIVLFVLGIGIVISVFVDCIIISSATILLLANKDVV